MKARGRKQKRKDIFFKEKCNQISEEKGDITDEKERKRLITERERVIERIAKRKCLGCRNKRGGRGKECKRIKNYQEKINGLFATLYMRNKGVCNDR